MNVPLTVADLTDALWPQRVRPLTPAESQRIERLLEVGQHTVDDYAPAAPQVLKNEAVIRFSGYLALSENFFGTVRSESLGPRSAEHVTNHAAAFRNSGAAMIVTKHRRRRGGAC